MRSPGFRRFVAVFVGILLAADGLILLVTKEESMLVSFLGLLLVYGLYLTVCFKNRPKTEKAKKEKKSPLIR